MRFSTAEGFYSITSLPGQPNVAVCTDFTILPKYRGKGAAHRLKAHQNRQLSLLGYTLAICTTQNKNLAQAKVLMKAGWRRNISFFDSRTVAGACLWSYDVVAQDAVCPECGGELYTITREGDMLAPECTYKACDNCDYQSTPE